MDRSSSSAFSSSAFSTSNAPTVTSGAQPLHNTTAPNGYAELLARFPDRLRGAIEATFPEVDELAAFHQDFVDKGMPFDHEGVVAFVLNKAREQKLVAQRRILFLPLRQQGEAEKKGGENKKPIVNSSGPLHEAILTWDGALVRELLRQSASPGDVLQPEQRQREADAMAAVAAKHDSDRREASKTFEYSFGNEDALDAKLKEHIVDALQEARDQAEGVRATVFAAHAGENALTLAISYEAPMEVIALLVEHCARHTPALLNGADGNGNLPLTLAAASGNVEVVKLLLRSGAQIDIDRCNGKGHSALMEAARIGNAGIIRLLLECGARADLPNAQGRTARELAAIREHTDAFNALAEWEISLSGKTQDTSMGAKLAADLRHAAKRGNITVLENIHARLTQCVDAAGLRKAAQRALWSALNVNDNAAVVTWLLRHGASAEQVNKSGMPPQVGACDRGNLEALMAFALSGKPQQLGRAWRQSLLRLAAKFGSLDLVLYALDGGAYVDGASPDTKMTALTAAVQQDNRDIIKILLQRGARICFGDDGDDRFGFDGNSSPLEAATKAEEKAQDLVMFLLDHHPAPYAEKGAAKMLLRIALSMDMPELLERLIRDGQVDYDDHDDREKSLLMSVSEFCSGQFVRVLLSPPAPVQRLLNAENGNANAVLKSLVKRRAFHGKEVFNAILEACDISPHDDPDELLDRLCLAVQIGSKPSCELILKKGKLRLQPDALRDRNPLMLAVRLNKIKLIPLLLEHGAHACAMVRKTPESNSYKSALHVAWKCKREPWERETWKALPILMKHDPHLPAELGAILPSLGALIEKSIMEVDLVPEIPGEVLACLLQHTKDMPVPKPALQALLFSAARSGDKAVITELLQRGADPQHEHPCGADALALLLDSDSFSFECAGMLLADTASSSGGASEKEGATVFGVPGYSLAQENRLLEALTSQLIDDDRKIDIMCALIFASPDHAVETLSMAESRARKYFECLMPIATSIDDDEPEEVLAEVIEAATKMAQESGNQQKVKLISKYKRSWDV
ncbi:ankyrin repeat domain-containing protein [Noviherbaspirillum pedocola]|uniref:Ankyrin repeat domain-containing protein n=1 Tax=Noviherbaspirillum pedocola TaxID=2801341 RepID=A0A934SVU0_9BURK|nr:ankyrin repeat domain-containing protein [Noviherbaspirillum pedocola]MBK4733712.1 ankyrin repeat domain-containing protein [Noviherbaspirillum pedocola]